VLERGVGDVDALAALGTAVEEQTLRLPDLRFERVVAEVAEEGAKRVNRGVFNRIRPDPRPDTLDRSTACSFSPELAFLLPLQPSGTYLRGKGRAERGTTQPIKK